MLQGDECFPFLGLFLEHRRGQKRPACLPVCLSAWQSSANLTKGQFGVTDVFTAFNHTIKNMPSMQQKQAQANIRCRLGKVAQSPLLAAIYAMQCMNNVTRQKSSLEENKYENMQDSAAKA
jgi:hypothetical protein